MQLKSMPPIFIIAYVWWHLVEQKFFVIFIDKVVEILVFYKFAIDIL